MVVSVRFEVTIRAGLVVATSDRGAGERADATPGLGHLTLWSPRLRADLDGHTQRQEVGQLGDALVAHADAAVADVGPQ